MTVAEAVVIVRQMQAREQRCTGRERAKAIREAVETILSAIPEPEVIQK